MNGRGLNNFLPLILLLFLVACKHQPAKAPEKSTTPTSGEITLVADESVAPVILDAANTFHAIYGDATIHVSIKAEPEAVSDLVNDSVKLIVITR